MVSFGHRGSWPDRRVRPSRRLAADPSVEPPGRAAHPRVGRRGPVEPWRTVPNRVSPQAPHAAHGADEPASAKGRSRCTSDRQATPVVLDGDRWGLGERSSRPSSGPATGPARGPRHGSHRDGARARRWRGALSVIERLRIGGALFGSIPSDSTVARSSTRSIEERAGGSLTRWRRSAPSGGRGSPGCPGRRRRGPAGGHRDPGPGSPAGPLPPPRRPRGT
jgi:hypothetical protein